ncbi:MAG TPA: cyclic peptide export ABC transporter [Thermoanaerobaculia bacterium]|nr:cyclic peptide export ABC transporter [Thermoanaerobaculia bacterium]
MLALARMLSYLLRLSRHIRFSRSLMTMSALAGLASGLASAGMMALINTMISRSGTPSRALIWAFVGLCAGLPLLRYSSQLLLTKLTQNSLIVLRMRLTRSILAAPLSRLEAVGAPRLLATLTGDVGAVVGAMAMIPTLLMHLALVGGSLAYMGWLSWQVLLQTLVFIAFGVISYRMTLSRAINNFMQSRALQNDMMDRARATVEGTKELKMNRVRREAFLDSTEATIAALQHQNRTGTLAFAATSSWGQVLFFILVGLLVIVLPQYQPVDREVLIGYTIVLFQMMAPLEVLMGAIPALSQAAVATQTVENLGFSLEAETREQSGGEIPQAERWETLELAGVTHSYKRENEEESFLLGPIDLAFRPGELVFIVGGNGSGKTTLAKLLLGLYAPESGEIRFAGQAITDENREQYRQSFAAVFSDYFIFKTLYGLEASALNAEARRYLEKLHLEQKVQVEAGVLSTIDLSQGQRKRLALLTAYLEDRPIYLFDEWAADQDPIFKKIFYHELLPELKSRGKTVFVISHDDHYFHVADRIIKLDYGQLEFDQKAAEFFASAGPAAVLTGGAAPA